MSFFIKKHQVQPRVYPEDGTSEKIPLVKIYKKDVFCMFPHNSQEINRLNFQHYLFKQALQANYLAPIVNPDDVLDVACGTGRWMYEMANTFPTASITGIDLIPPTKKESRANFPPSCEFVAGNIIDGLPFVDQSFDFVHQRMLTLSLPSYHWPINIRELIRVTRRGGWIELMEVDLEQADPGPATMLISTWIKQVINRQGSDGTIGRKIESFLQSTSLINIGSRKVSIPLGSWGGRLGTMLAKDYTTAINSIKPLLLANNRIKAHEVDQAIDLWLQECNQNHISYDFFTVYGQRP